MLTKRALLVGLASLAMILTPVAPVSAERAGAPAGSGARDIGERFVAGDNFTCFLGNDGRIRCWGDNSEGQLGIGSTSAAELAPVVVQGITDAVEIAAGGATTCALLADATVRCWGRGVDGQLGHGQTNSSPSPVVVRNMGDTAPLSSVTAIAVGFEHACAVSSGSVYCWGDEIDGHLGNGSNSLLRNLPVRVMVDASTPLTGVVDISASASATCARAANGATSCWGSNYYQQIIIGGSGNYAYATSWAPATSEGGLGMVSVGGRHICGATATKVVCMGGESSSAAYHSSATRPSPYYSVAKSVAQIVASNSGACVVTVTATLECTGSLTAGATKSIWGSGSSATTFWFTSASVAEVQAVAAGGDHFCVYLAEGIKCWGKNSSGQIGNGATSVVVDTLSTVSYAEAGTVTIGDPGSKNVESAPFDVTVSANSGAVPTLAVAPGSAAVCSLSGTRLTVLGAGNCVVNASAAANGFYTSATASRSIVVAALEPTVADVAGSASSLSEATVSASVNARGAEASVKVQYGTSSDLATFSEALASAVPSGIASQAVSVSLTLLSPGTTYSYRVVVTNSVGLVRSDIKSFTTKGSKPTVITGSATRGVAGMTVNGKVNPKELETTIHFEYGTDPKLVGAQKTTARTQSGADEVDVSAAIGGLEENTTYYYRIIASNAVGSSEGEIRSFTTTKAEGVSINDSEEFTSSQKVTVSVVGPTTAVKAILSNDGGFKTSETFDLVNNSADIPWTLQSSREGTFTKIVYVKFVSRFGAQSLAQTDDIILDTTKPVMSAATATPAAAPASAVTVSRVGVSAKKAVGGVRLSLRGSDTISGIGSIEVRSAANKPATKVKVSRVAGKADGKPRAASQTVSLKTTAKRLQVRVIDRAGNASAWRTIVVR